jgi:hypothetical protein
MLRKVLIKKLPKAGYGRPVNEGYMSTRRSGFSAGSLSKDEDSIRKNLTSVPEEEANVEAEGGETVVGDFQKDGLNEFFNIEGPRHADGPGVPLNLPKSFIFSDTRAMKIKDQAILKLFGKSGGSYTPAKLSKKYQLNDHNAKLLDEDSDKLDIDTAEQMIQNKNDKLAQLAIIQEVLLKGDKVPEFAYPYLEARGVDIGELMQEQDQDNDPQFRKGGEYLPKAQIMGGFNPADTAKARSVEKMPDDYTRYEKSPSYGYKITPGQKVNTDTKSSFTPEDIFSNKGKYSTFHRKAAEAGITDPDEILEAARILHKTGVMPSKTDVVKVNTAQPIGQPATIQEKTTLEKIPSRAINEIPRDPRPFEFPEYKANSEEEYDMSGYKKQPFFRGDVMNLYKDAINRFSTVDIPPTMMNVPQARTMNPVLEDPTRAIAANQEQTNKGIDAAIAFGRNPASVASYLEGASGAGVADIISGVNQRNINTLNQTAGINRQALAQQDQMETGARRQYDIDSATYQQQKSNTKSAFFNNFMESLKGGYDNQMNLGMINAKNPNWFFDTAKSEVTFRPGVSPTTMNRGVMDDQTYEFQNRDLELKLKKARIESLKTKKGSDPDDAGYVRKKGGKVKGHAFYNPYLY